MGRCSKVPAIHIFAVFLGSLEIVLFGGVVFGWHSIVYIYKDSDYFSHLCPPQKSYAAAGNITWHYHPHGSNVSVLTHVNLNPNDTAANSTGTTLLPSSNMTYSSVRDFPSPNQRSSIHFDELSCEEKIQVRAEEGVAQVCKPQDEQFNLIFSLSTGINGIMSFPSGILYDRLGTRISRIISMEYARAVRHLPGASLFNGANQPMWCSACQHHYGILSYSANPYLLYPGYIGLVYGGYQLLLTNLQLSCLIPSMRSTIMSLYSGSYDSSSSIFLLFKTAYEGGVSVNTSFAVQATLYFLIIVSSSFFFLPKTRIPFPPIPGYRLRCWPCQKLCGKKNLVARENCTSNEWKVDPTGSVIITKRASLSKGNLDSAQSEVPLTSNHDVEERNEREVEAFEVEQQIAAPLSDDEATATVTDVQPPEEESDLQKKRSQKKKTFRQVALSPLFLTDLLWISSQRLRSWIFVGMFNPWITRLACGDKALVSHYTSVYAGMQFFGILTAPLSGLLMDRKIKGAEKYGNPRYERLHASIASFVLNSTVAVLLTICTLIPILKLQYLTFVLHCLHRSFLYGPNSAFVANAFPNEHFGKLFGVTLTVSAVFSTMQYPLFIIVQEFLGGDPFAISMFLLVLMLISYIHPIYIWCYLKKKVSKSSRS